MWSPNFPLLSKTVCCVTFNQPPPPKHISMCKAFFFIILPSWRRTLACVTSLAPLSLFHSGQHLPDRIDAEERPSGGKCPRAEKQWVSSNGFCSDGVSNFCFPSVSSSSNLFSFFSPLLGSSCRKILFYHVEGDAVVCRNENVNV